MFRSLLSSPLALAALVTLANAVKPVTVDDTAYLFYARHNEQHPTDPYGFSMFWWSEPEPAMNVLCPPVVPYYLAAGMALLGDSPPLLKLWFFPFVYLLAWALRALLARFARGTEAFALPLLTLSPAILPTVNLMLDVPAVALALASIEVFIRGMARRSWWSASLAGVLAGVAMQTKYTAFVAPAVMAWYGVAHRRFSAGGNANALGMVALGVGLSVGIFVGWEALLVELYGQSHFLFHASGAGSEAPGDAKGISAVLREKRHLIPPLVGQLGGLAAGVGLFAASVLRLPRRRVAAVAVVWVVGFAILAVVPRRWTAIHKDVSVATAFWQAAGWCWLAAVAGCSGILLFRLKKGLGLRSSADSWFLVGWLAIEIAASLALSPFPAARRVIGVTLVAGLVAARAASLIQRAHPDRRPPQWVLAVGVAAGVVVAAIDTLDAFPERVCAERAAEVIRARSDNPTAWFAGHWGFQYYCERAGMKPLVPEQTVVHAGDFVVLPVYPDEPFPRPYAGIPICEPLWEADEVAEIEWNDWLSARTVANLYGGAEPVVGRDFPRLRIRVYRLRTDCVMRK